jgi:hypothetical protein
VTLVVRAPSRHDAERRYILDVVLGEWLGLAYRLETAEGADVVIEPDGVVGGPVLRLPDVLFAIADADWLTERSLPTAPLSHVALREIGEEPAPGRLPALVAAGDDPLPLLFGRALPDDAAWERTRDGIRLAADVFGTAFFMLSRYEEVARPVRDDRGRSPASASLAATEGFMERPIVDAYVDLLWAAMRTLWPALERRPSAFRLRLTHDVDDPWSSVGQRTGQVFHALAGDLVRRRDPDLAMRRLRGIADARRGRFDRDPFDTFELLMATSERNGLRSTFYFLAGNEPGEPDFRYRIDHPRIVDLLRRVHERGHEVGLHASYASYRSPERIDHEFAALRAACRLAGFDQPSWGVRQHYLRFEVPVTWAAHEAAGFEHDSTLGYADAVGFRAGTGREFPLFDVVAGRPLRLRERPLLVMDVTMLGYLGLTPAQASTTATRVVAAARRHATDAVVLYHNSTLPGRGLQRHYRDLVDALVSPAGSRPPATSEAGTDSADRS